MLKLNSLVLLSLFATAAHAQFTCTFAGAKDADECVGVMDDSNDHCVWCALSRSEKDDEKQALLEEQDLTDFGFCVAEVQAEAMEQSIPNIHCDRYKGNDDDATPATDDGAPDDDEKPSSDDDAKADDDQVPDDYWTCLQVKKEADCESKGCTWCGTKAGFSLCMSGPTADAAEESDWFTCKTEVDEEVVVLAPVDDPLDTSCVAAFLADQTEQGCVSATDADGMACSWCELAGLSNICLTQEQAEISAQLGVTCDATAALIPDKAQDPYDPACLIAYLQDQSKDACVSAVDEDGTPCEYCSLQGSLTFCLTADQADMGAQVGITCDAESIEAQDPYDPSCLLAYLQDPSKTGCVAAADADGNSCEFCTLQGALNICLTEEQAEMGEQIGITCSSSSAVAATSVEVEDPYDPSCALVYLQDPTKIACVAAMDADGKPCEFCTLQGALQLCLNEEQAEMGEQIGITCEKSATIDAADPYDPSCALAFLSDNSKEACEAALDGDGNACEYCSLQGSLFLCLNDEQAEMGEQVGMSCGSDIVESRDPFDYSCMAAFFTEQSLEQCTEAVDQDGNPCEYCSMPGSMVLCLSPDQASIGEELVDMECETVNGAGHALDVE